MTLTDRSLLSPANGARYDDAEARAGAEAALRTDPQLTGDALGTLFPRLDGKARSAEWGRKMKRRHGGGTAPAPVDPPTGTGNGTARGTIPAPARTRSTVPKAKPRTGAPKGGTRDRWQTAVCAIVGLAAAAWSAGHTVHLAQMAGFGRWAYVVPVTIDGLIFVCGRHVRTVDGYWVAKLGLALGIIATMAANLVAIDPALAAMEDVRRAMALAPPLAFVICVHLLERGAK